MTNLVTWMIYRGVNFLGAFTGSYSEASEYAVANWGIGCSVIRE